MVISNLGSGSGGSRGRGGGGGGGGSSDGALLQSLSELVPRLWMFLSHNITSVRTSCLKALYTLLSDKAGREGERGEEGGKGERKGEGEGEGGKEETEIEREAHLSWIENILQSFLCHVFQRFLLEGDEGNTHLLHQVRYMCAHAVKFHTVQWREMILLVGVPLAPPQVCRGKYVLHKRDTDEGIFTPNGLPNKASLNF